MRGQGGNSLVYSTICYQLGFQRFNALSTALWLAISSVAVTKIRVAMSFETTKAASSTAQRDSPVAAALDGARKVMLPQWFK
jgi:hypothetical protein